MTISFVALLSVLGGLVVIAGLYMLLWGKERDEKVDMNAEEPNDNNAQRIDSGVLNGEP